MESCTVNDLHCSVGSWYHFDEIGLLFMKVKSARGIQHCLTERIWLRAVGTPPKTRFWALQICTEHCPKLLLMSMPQGGLTNGNVHQIKNSC